MKLSNEVRLAARHRDELAIGHVGGQRAVEAAVLAAAFDLPAALALGGPQEPAAVRVFQPARHVLVEVDPGVVVLGEQGGSVTPRGVGFEQGKIRLVAGKDRQRERTVFHPTHLAQVRIFRAIPVEPDRLAGSVDEDYAQTHVDVVLARARVEAADGFAARLGRIGDVPSLDLRSVAFLVHDAA